MKELPEKRLQGHIHAQCLADSAPAHNWAGFFLLPLFFLFFLTDEMEDGLPQRVPAAIVDKDGSAISRQITQNLGSMQMVDLVEDCNSFTQARHDMQSGKVFGFFPYPRGVSRPTFLPVASRS